MGPPRPGSDFPCQYHKHHIMLNIPPGPTSPTDNQSLHPDTTSPFASDNPTYSHSTTTTTTPTQTNTQHHHDIESGGATSTSGRSREESLDDTILLMDRISALEQQLNHERTTVTNLSSTLEEERVTFEDRMLRMEQMVNRISTTAPKPPPSNIKTLSQTQIDTIAQNRAAAITLRMERQNNPIVRQAVKNPYTQPTTTTAPPTTHTIKNPYTTNTSSHDPPNTPDTSQHSLTTTTTNTRSSTPEPSQQQSSLTPAQKSRIADNKASAISILAHRKAASLAHHQTTIQSPTQTSLTSPQSAPNPQQQNTSLDPNIHALFEQQNRILAQNSSLITALTTTVSSMHTEATTRASVARDTLAEQINARKIKGPSSTNFPKYSNESTDDIIKWYNDILAIVSLSEWKGIHDNTTNTIVPNTLTSNSTISEHFYKSLRLAFKKNAATIMDAHTVNLHGRGIEFFHMALTIFNPKWPESDHSNKLISFYQFFRPPKMSVDEFSSKFKRWTSQLRYNS